MVRILLYILIGYGLYLLARIFLRKSRPPRPRRGDEVETFRDPVCGVYVTRGDAVSAKIEGKWVYFCSTECRDTYRRNLENTA
ncbi:MAG TPA: YHS domain-containing protein [Geobacteraceae bacterium]|nr:YHS domain-containing protein [Geobacteraceae bacterium]